MAKSIPVYRVKIGASFFRQLFLQISRYVSMAYSPSSSVASVTSRTLIHTLHSMTSGSTNGTRCRWMGGRHMTLRVAVCARPRRLVRNRVPADWPPRLGWLGRYWRSPDLPLVAGEQWCCSNCSWASIRGAVPDRRLRRRLPRNRQVAVRVLGQGRGD